VVGLFGYMVKGAAESGRLKIDPSLLTALFVPIAALSIWWTIRRIRKKHIPDVD
jgi:uncharacterized membrane-anchored protein